MLEEKYKVGIMSTIPQNKTEGIKIWGESEWFNHEGNNSEDK